MWLIWYMLGRPMAYSFFCRWFRKKWGSFDDVNDDSCDINGLSCCCLDDRILPFVTSPAVNELNQHSKVKMWLWIFEFGTIKSAHKSNWNFRYLFKKTTRLLSSHSFSLKINTIEFGFNFMWNGIFSKSIKLKRNSVKLSGRIYIRILCG